MILTDFEVASLKWALSWWEWFGYVSTAVVGLGCVGEFVAEFTSLPKCEQRRHKIAKLSLIILILGIAGELLSAVRTSQLSGQLIANIEEHAESEHLARVKIEQSIAWRSLSQNNESLISDSLAPFHEQQFSIWFDAGDAEGAAFAWDIAGVLHRTKLNVYSPAAVGHLPPSGTPFDPSAAALKTGIEVSSTEAIRSRIAAKVLVQDFIASGFDAVISAKPQKGEQAVVWVNIRTRPKGPQGEAKLSLESNANKEQTQSR